MRPDRICPICGGSKNEDESLCGVCVLSGEGEEEDPLDDLA